MLYGLYSAATTTGCRLLSACSPVLEGLRPQVFHSLRQRLGFYPSPNLFRGDPQPVIWLHAASVGEVQAARNLIRELAIVLPEYRLVLTTMTVQGQLTAQRQLGEEVECLLAPLDALTAVRRACTHIRPDLYLCLETELWPVLLTELHHQGIPAVLLNGRMSSRSCRRYGRFAGLFQRPLEAFTRLAVISESDRQRFCRLGVPSDRVVVSGNLKYDLWPEDPSQMRLQRRKELQADSQTVFVCGSTRTGEEKLLLSVFHALQRETETLWVIAPRHLERLDKVRSLLRHAGLACDALSEVRSRGRREGIVLVDCMGELAELYAAADVVFCGGSLVPKGGHNIMEAARWGVPVLFGPHMSDFQDAAELLCRTGGGFQAENVRVLTEQIVHLVSSPDAHAKASGAARSAAAAQQGATARQVALVRGLAARPRTSGRGRQREYQANSSADRDVSCRST